MLWLLVLIQGNALWLTHAQLPDGCVPLNESPLSTSDPGLAWGYNSDLEAVAPPKRVGSWAGSKAIPTHHFADNQNTNNMVSIQLFPYVAFLFNDGVAYDAYTLDRWSDPARTEAMYQQTPSVPDEPWNVIESVGTNMRQKVVGPDGNPKADFSGRSGIKVSIPNTGEPVWRDFSDLHATWRYTSVETAATMEVPMVRGSPLLTHLVTGSNPTLLPYCLSSVNGQSVSYQCPAEYAVLEKGSGYLDGSSCSAGSLHIIFRSTKPVDLKDIQYAATPIDQWPGAMTNCGSACTLSEDKKRVDIILPGSGIMAYAINVVGADLIPSNWVEEPLTSTCMVNKAEWPDRFTCTTDGYCDYPSCAVEGGGHRFNLQVVLDVPIGSSDAIQFAVQTAEVWVNTATHAPMLTCGDPTFECTVSPDGTTIDYSKAFDSPNIKYAVNVIGRFVQPAGDWQSSPFTHTCQDDATTTTTTPPSTTTTTTTTTTPTTTTTGQTTTSIGGATGTTTAASTTTTTAGGTVPPLDECFCATTPALPACTSSVCKYHFTKTAPDGVNQFLKVVLVLPYSVGGMDDVQVAFNKIENWQQSHPMITCTADRCEVSADGTHVTFCTSATPGGYAFAVNIVGRDFIPSDWENNPIWIQAGAGGTDLGVDTKFVLELEEPNNVFPDQTRRFAAFFSEEVRATLDANGLSFAPSAGGLFTGWVQLGYLGVSTRGDTSNDGFYDQYVGTYPYKPTASYCVNGDTGYINFNWDRRGGVDLLMTALPHHEAYLKSQGTLLDTPFGYKGFVAAQWLLTEQTLPRASVLPDPDGVQAIMQNPEQLQDILDGLDLDLAGYQLNDSCTTGGSYWAGKDIAMTARAASISRAFNTNHYVTFDETLKWCLNKWIRADDTLNEGDRFHYDTVWGGLIARGVTDSEPIDPGANFGFPTYNDHHFHLGYWVYAMAYYAEYYPEWAQANREAILYYVRDFGNPSTLDPYFPFARHKDVYLGHSWASGIAGGVRTQESSSESVNAYHAMAGLGHAMNDPVMENMGRILLAMEIRSVRQYYHVRPENKHNFPPHIQTYGCIGMFSEDAIYLYTLYWPCAPNIFPARHACLVGIQVLPITAVSHLYMDQDWANSVHAVCSWSVDPTLAPGSEGLTGESLTPVSFGWGALCLAASSAKDVATTQTAADYIRGKGPRDHVSGTGSASTYLFLYGRT